MLRALRQELPLPIYKPVTGYSESESTINFKNLNSKQSTEIVITFI